MNPEAWLVVSSLGSAIRSGTSTLEDIPGLLKRLLAEELWREFRTPRGEIVHYERFVDFLATPPTQGLGTSTDVVRRLVKDDTEALDLYDRALQRTGGRPETLDNVQGKGVEAPTGNGSDAALRRLRKDRPDLHARVLADELKPHAAMVLAGFRPRTATVRLDDVKATARTLRRQLDVEARQRLADLLTEAD